MDVRNRKYKLMSKGKLEDWRRKDRETIRTARRQMDQFDRRQMDQFDRREMDQFGREINRSKVIFAALVGLISGFLILQIVGIV
jgi:hypothetical protein